MRTKLLLLMLFFAIAKMSAQGLPCRTTEENAKLYRNNPSSLQEKKEFDAFSKKFAVQRKSTTSKEAATTYTIPVVFHIYGDVQSGKTVTYEKIVSHLAQLNDDFNGRNADFQTVESFFQARRGILNIEFKLAKIDPNGGCTSGVVFHPAKNGYGNGGGYDSQIAADAWDNKKYMNIYIQNDLYNEGVFNNSGVAWYPDTYMMNNNTARVVFNGAYLYDNSSNKEFSATLTHEFGHFMNLIHTFDGGCSGTDEVDDTPKEDGKHTLACTPGTNCDGDKVNFENYMGYNGAQGCYKMYTQGQITRMLAALQHPARVGLWQPQNLIDTGVNLSGSTLVAAGTIFKEAVANDGSSASTSVVTITGGKKFALSSGTMVSGTHYTHTFPAGITPVITVNSSGQLTITLSGKATNHAASNNTSGGIVFLPAAFTGGTTDLACTSLFYNFKFTDPYGVFFVDMADIAISSSLTWKPFDIAKGDDTSFGGWRFAANELKIETYGKKLVCETGSRNISFLGQNVAVGPTSNMTAPGAYPDQLDLRTASYTSWQGKSGYVGFEYQMDGATCYGWFKVAVAANGDSFTISEYAYNTQPNTPIYTGMTAKTAVVLSVATLYEAESNDGGVSTTSTISLSTNNGTFTKSSGTLTAGTHYTITGVPSGLTAVLTLQGNNNVVVSFTGKASAHLPANDASVVITFKDAAITGGIATLDAASKTIAIKFDAPYGIFYVNNTDYVASAAQSWLYFDLAIGDNTEYGVWQFAAAALKMETYGKRLVTQTGTRNISFISQGTSIGASSNFTAPGAYPDQLDLRTATYTTWDNQTGYVGFEYTNRGKICYGWMHVKVEAGGVGYTVLDFAYNSKPGESIQAGTQITITVLAPSSLVATANNANLEVNLTWVNNATNATNVVVERAGTDGVFAEIATLGAAVTTYKNTGLTAGTTYKYKVRAKANTVYSAYSNEVSATITANSAYCTTQANNSYEYINSVTIGSFTNTSGKDAASYADYTSKTVTLTPNTSMNVSLAAGFSGSAYTEYWGVWIDYNKNNLFEASEKVIDGISSNSTATGNFTPIAFAGSTRMRVVMKYNANPAACGNIVDGEVEDYTVVSGTITPPIPVTLPTPIPSTAGVYSSGLYASWNTIANATSYEVQLNNATTGWTTFGTSTSYYLWIPKQGTQTVYQFRVRAKNATEVSEWSASKTVDLQGGNVGPEEMDQEKTFMMYPNPASDVVNFSFTNLDVSKIRITIYDSNGAIVDVLENTTTYTVNHLRRGVYIVVATDGNFIEKKKLLVK